MPSVIERCDGGHHALAHGRVVRRHEEPFDPGIDGPCGERGPQQYSRGRRLAGGVRTEQLRKQQGVKANHVASCAAHDACCLQADRRTQRVSDQDGAVADSRNGELDRPASSVLALAPCKNVLSKA